MLSWDSWCVLIDKLSNSTDQRAMWSGKIKGPALARYGHFYSFVDFKPQK